MQVFDNYCTPMMGGGEDDYSLDKDKVCRSVIFLTVFCIKKILYGIVYKNTVLYTGIYFF
jgi:hypothetical protein